MPRRLWSRPPQPRWPFCNRCTTAPTLLAQGSDTALLRRSLTRRTGPPPPGPLSIRDLLRAGSCYFPPFPAWKPPTFHALPFSFPFSLSFFPLLFPLLSLFSLIDILDPRHASIFLGSASKILLSLLPPLHFDFNSLSNLLVLVHRFLPVEKRSGRVSRNFG